MALRAGLSWVRGGSKGTSLVRGVEVFDFEGSKGWSRSRVRCEETVVQVFALELAGGGAPSVRRALLLRRDHTCKRAVLNVTAK